MSGQGVDALATVRILGARFFCTHHASPADAIAGVARAPVAPAYALLVGRARRFTSLVTQLHLEVAAELARLATEPPITVFATVHGEIQTADVLVSDFRANAVVSSARFALSVHNTPAGLFSVATGSHAASTTVTGTNALAMGWLEAALTAAETGRPVLLSIADEPVAAAFQGPAEVAGLAAAFLLARAPAAGRTATLRATPADGAAPQPMIPALARAALAFTQPDAATIPLGPLRAGAMLELALP